MTSQTIVISGATGLIGTALTERLVTDGHQVVALVRGAGSAPKGSRESLWDPKGRTLDPNALSGADAVVHLAGAGIGDKRWTDDYKRELVESRTIGTGLIASTIASLPEGERPKALISGSAIGFYGESETATFTESSPAGPGFLADLCVQWEAATTPAADAGVRVAHIRTGIVLSDRGGALKKMLPLFKFGAGGPFGNGRQWQSWISLDDEVSAIVHLLSSQVSGAVNLTAPEPVTNKDFANHLAKALHRPSLLPVPRFGPALLLGGELADALLYTGQKVLPEVLQADGFTFAHPTLDAALGEILGGKAA